MIRLCETAAGLKQSSPLVPVRTSFVNDEDACTCEYVYGGGAAADAAAYGFTRKNPPGQKVLCRISDSNIIIPKSKYFCACSIILCTRRRVLQTYSRNNTLKT